MSTENRLQGSAIAGGFLSVALIETLVEKGILSLADARLVTDRALNALKPHCNTAPIGFFAAEVIGGLQKRLAKDELPPKVA